MSANVVMDGVEGLKQPVIKIKAAQHLRAGAVLAINLYGLLLGLPVLVAVAWVSFRPLDATTYIVPLIATALATVFLPFGFGNPHARRIGRRLRPPFAPDQARLVQLGTTPRLVGGLRGLLEDADDIGYLHLGPKGLVFFGDSLHMEAPFESIEEVSLHNVGFRGLYIYAPKIRVRVRGVQPGTFEFADRFELWLPAARKETAKLFRDLKARSNPGQTAPRQPQ
jgi:hypothetical protein